MFSILALATHILANVTEAAKMVDGSDLAPSNKVRQIRIAGDLMLGGVFPVHTKSQNPDEPCGEIAETRGVHRVEAMLYALDQINAQKDFLRGYKLVGADAFKKEARKKGICIAIEERIQNKKESFVESIDNLVKKLQPDKKVGARVVVLFVGTEYVPELLKHTAERMKLSAGYSKKKIIW
ncbi:hypothetical protein ANCDUO_16989 [Ancylostoma duodenale]|uniref:Receptor ligand binding region domain-containing protein n=1 Tax=Ancylostoma duodenale TaxID=51022 RepID=A0A0C2FWH5_9BILA|nr:hypothetical protein ANCDUO_16989 [Ancylostoma duodenale]